MQQPITFDDLDDADIAPPERKLLEVGTMLGTHTVIRGVLGEGGTAVVYDAWHVELERAVAVKMLHPHARVAREARARLIREARICESVHDPRVPKVYFIDELDDGTPYMVMEKIEGPTLQKLIESGPLPIGTACTIIAHLLEGLAAIHGRGVVHRDIKPSNVILQPRDDGTVRIRLMDFGIGKLNSASPDVTGITRQGDIIGTPCYMPPEQLTGRSIDARADLYACGIVMFEMLSGKLPFHAGSVAEVVAAVLRDEIPSVRTLRADIPVAVAEVITKATAKDPAHRHASAERMKLALVSAQRASRQEPQKPAAVLEPVGQYV
ncbi:MAG TPA: serine/threonine-protein kinase [Polyangiales bacterium]|nr:serine/threonine-protein kinase [Polyangiales bacterium]